MDNDLSNQRIVIVGGSTGFGLATAQAAAKLGARVIIASSNQGKLDRALATLPKSAEARVVDASSEAALKSLFAELGDIDHLVYSAGEPIALGPLADTAAADAQKFFVVRFWGAFNAARFAQIKQGGSITFTSGTAGKRPGKGWSVGAAICSAMEGFTRALAVELAPTRVNCVCPGAIDTDLWSSLGEQRQAVLDTFAKQIPVGRVGRADEVSAAYLFLLRNGFVSGSVLTVDGGGVLG